MKKLIQNMAFFMTYITSPYAFQIWIAPRNKLYEWITRKNSFPYHSPPGFGSFKSDYKIYLYPDNLIIYWFASFLCTVLTPFMLHIFFISTCQPTDIFSCNSINRNNTFYDHFFCYSLAGGIIIFLLFYFFIYLVMRRPILDNVLEKKIINEKMFRTIPARITFSWREHFCTYFYRYRTSEAEDKFTSNFTKKTCFFNRPVFYNPGKSIQEAVLRTGIVSFFAARKKNKTYNVILLIFYHLGHVWVAYFYLLVELIIILIHGDKPKSNIMMHITLQSILWGAASSAFLTIHYLQSRILIYNDKQLFSFAPSICSAIIHEGTNINKDVFHFLNPKITFPAFVSITELTLIAIINIIVQS